MLLRPLLGVAVLAAAASQAQAVTIVDTGTPGGSAIGAYAVDTTDAYAGQFGLTAGASLQSIGWHLLGVAAGETFTVRVYGDDPAHRPGTLLYSAAASAVGDGWNDTSALTGWMLGAGTYWAAIEVDPTDTLGSGSLTGALLDVGAPMPLASTAFNDGSGYRVNGTPLGVGLRIDGTVAAVPEASSALLLALGLAALALHGRWPGSPPRRRDPRRPS